MSNLVFENENYAVYVMPVHDAAIDRERDGYKLFNKNTNVEEFSTFILPEARLWAGKLNDDLLEDIAEEEVEKVLN